MKAVAKNLLVVLFWAAVWHILALSLNNPLLLPTPLQVLERLGALAATAAFWKTTLFSLGRILLGITSGIALVPEGRHVFANLTVRENLKIGAYLRKDNDGIAKDMEKVQETIDKLKARREKLLDLNVAGHLSDEDFAGMVKEIGRQLEQQKELLTSLQEKQDKTLDIQKRLQTIQAAFDSFDSLTTPEDITPALVDAVISRIDVTTMGDVIQLDFRLADGTTLAEELTSAAHPRGRKKNSSAGYSRKRLIEQAERGMAGQ